MEDRLLMSAREADRLSVVRQVMEGKIKQVDAARWIRLSVRQVGRLVRRVREQGSGGILHQGRGKPSNNGIGNDVRNKVMSWIQEKYRDFGPTLAQEKLEKVHKVKISRETLRKWMISSGMYRDRKRGKIHRRWRERRGSLGELVQLDGSLHDWFEGRGPRCVLVAYVDDASSRLLYAEFVPSEDTYHLFRTTKGYLKRFGRPLTFYVDRDSIYRVNRQARVEEELQDIAPLTQFGRAMRELEIELLPAFSPQAKGRVERTFRTHQDRLVKELRLAGVRDIAGANRFLWQTYLPDHNRRCSVEPSQPNDAHRALLRTQDMDAILAFQSPRTLLNDWTIQYQNRFFQLDRSQPCHLRPKMVLLVEHRLDGKILLHYKGHRLGYQPIAKKSYRPWYLRRRRVKDKYNPGTIRYASHLRNSQLTHAA